MSGDPSTGNWLDGLGQMRVVFWTCPDGHSERSGVETVRWVDGVAHCTMPRCTRTSVPPSTRPDATLDQLRTLIDLANERHLHDAEQWLRERVEAAEERMAALPADCWPGFDR